MDLFHNAFSYKAPSKWTVICVGSIEQTQTIKLTLYIMHSPVLVIIIFWMLLLERKKRGLKQIISRKQTMEKLSWMLYDGFD